MAHKKAAWSAKNLRDSQPKFRGVKVFWWQKVTAWGIIVRQKWNKYEAWKNTYLWNDYSIHASIDGVVRFSKSNKKRFDGRIYLKTVVNVDSVEEKIEKKVTAKKVDSTEEKVEKKASVKKTTEKKTTTRKTVTKKTTE